MVQMGDSVAVERCVQHLNNIPVGDKGKLQIALVVFVVWEAEGFWDVDFNLIFLFFQIFKTEFSIRSYKSL